MIYRLTYCNKDDIEARIDIQKGSSTPVIEVEGTERPFILSYNNDKGDKSGMFLSSSADIEIYETTDFNIDNLKTSNETELSVTHYINNVISWQGFIIPDFFSIEVRNNPVITMTASDRLGTLKNATLSELPTMVNIRELILTCLSKTGLSLPLKTIADFSNDGTNNAFFSYYVDSQRIKDIKGRSISCYDILSSILTASNSKLVQRAGEWVIINKLQHEIGSGKIYSSLSSFTNYLENIYNFEEVSIGARRTIMPVAGSVGIYHEHGGRKSHPINYDYSLGLSGWNSVNGFVATIENRHIIGFLGGTPLFDTERTVKQYLLNYNNWIDDTNNLNTAPYITTDAIPINSPRADRVEVTVDISSTMAEKLSSNTAISFLRYAVILTNGVKTYTLTKAGIFEELDPENISGHSLLLRGGQQPPLLLASPAFSNSDSFKGLFEVGEDDDVNNYSVTIRVYGSGDQYVTVNYALIKFSDVSELPKGTMYKTEQGEVFTKAYDIETSIFGDYLLSGLDGYFYRYPNDDTSSIYKDVNTLSSPIWTTPSIPNETSELPLLHHSMRQMRRMFSVAHDLLSAEIEATHFDPLAIFVACGIRHTVVSAQFDFFKSNLSVELEEVAFQNATVRDFIYSYFGDGESGIKSIGGISGGTGGGGSTGGGLTPEQIEILSWWKKDPDNPNTIFTEMNAYSKLELSAYGAGDGEGGGSYERLDAWADYNSSKAEWVLSAFLGNDLNTRVTNLEQSGGGGGEILSFVTSGTGNAVTSIEKSGTIVTAYKNGSFLPLTGGTLTGNINITPLEGSLGVRTHRVGGSAYMWPNGFSLSSIRTGLGFGWYDTEWVIGNIRDGATGSYGFGIGYRNADGNLNGEFRIAVGGIAYLNNVQIATRSTTLAGYGITDAYTKTEVNSALSSKLDKSVFDDLFEKVEVSTGVFAIKAKYNFYGVGEISAYGIGSGGGSGDGIIETVYGYGNLGQTFNNANLTDTFNAYTINQINTRLVAVESGSALTVNTTGTGNAVTSISKAGSVITANKNLTFLETSIFNTHNNDNIRHITGAERTKWDGVVTDFDNLEIGGRNLLLDSHFYSGDLSNASSYISTLYNTIRNVSNGIATFEVTNSSTANRLEKTIQDLEVGRIYTYSTKTTISNGSFYGLVGASAINTTKNEIDTGVFIDSLTFEATNSTVTLRLYFGDVANGTMYDMHWFTLVEGNKGISWTPAPEDQVSDWLTTDVNSFSFIKNKPTTLSGYGITDATQRATTGGGSNSMMSLDTRDVDEIPNTDRAEGMWLDFKSSSAIGLTGLGQGTFSGVLTILPYVDSSGNSTSGGRIALSNGNLFTQKANATDYTNWNKLAFITDNVASATKLQTSRTIWGQSFDGTGNVTGALSEATTIAASISVTTPKVIFAAAGWSMEQVGSELQMKHNNVLKMRFTSAGSIVATEEITAFG